MKLYKIKKSNIDNRGLYAAKNIKAGKIVIHYKGKLITKKETENTVTQPSFVAKFLQSVKQKMYGRRGKN